MKIINDVSMFCTMQFKFFIFVSEETLYNCFFSKSISYKLFVY